MDFKKIKTILEKMYFNSWNPYDLKHANYILEVLLELKPNADISLKIAAFAHDIDRASKNSTNKKDFKSKDEYLKAHSLNSAHVISEILTENSFPKKIIDDVFNLVKNHEVGGNFREQLICDADTISFFKYYGDIYFETRNKNLEKTKAKFKKTFGRLSKKRQKYLKNIKFKHPKLNDILSSLLNEN
jgi:hypothetical protein